MGKLKSANTGLPLQNSSSQSTVQILPEVPIGGIIMQDSFASGDFSNPTGGSWYGSKHTEITTSFGRTHNSCIKFTFNPQFAEHRFDLDGAHPEVWLQWYIYFPDGTEGLGPRVVMLDDPTSGDNNKFFRLWGNPDSNSPIGNHLSVGASTIYTNSVIGDGSAFIELKKPRPDSTNCSNPLGIGDAQLGQFSMLNDAVRGKWQKIDFHAKVATFGQSNGIAEMWIDNVLQKSTSSWPTHGNTDACIKGFTSGYLLGATNAPYPAGTNIYIDDFIASSTALL